MLTVSNNDSKKARSDETSRERNTLMSFEQMQKYGIEYEFVMKHGTGSISIQSVVDFCANHGFSCKPNRLKKLFCLMSDSGSHLREFLRQRVQYQCFDDAIQYDWNLIKLREAIKTFENISGDQSHHWLSSTPMNQIIFYQIFNATNKKSWVRTVFSDRINEKPNPKPTSKQISEYDHCVYVIRNKKNGKMYVGRTKHFFKRMKQHQSPHSQCRLIALEIQKHGIGAFDIHIHAMGSEESMKFTESSIITALNTIAPHGYNLRCGDTQGMNDEENMLLDPTAKWEGVHFLDLENTHQFEIDTNLRRWLKEQSEVVSTEKEDEEYLGIINESSQETSCSLEHQLHFLLHEQKGALRDFLK